MVLILFSKLKIPQLVTPIYSLSENFANRRFYCVFRNYFPNSYPKLLHVFNTGCELKRFTYSITCWRCKTPTKTELFCSKCSSIQKPPNPIDYFKLLSLEKQFEIDEKNLNTNFKKLQMHLHPDKFSLKSQDEQVIADEYSALVNKAYSTLRQPLTRGIYMLESAGIRIDEEATVDDPKLLIEIMELNEDVADVKTLESLESIDHKCNNVVLQTITSIANAFKNNEPLRAQNLLIRLRYYLNISSKISEKKLELGAW